MTNRGWAAHKIDNLALARSFVRQQAPYLSPTLYGLIPFPKPGLVSLAGGPLAVTERLVLLYEPEWVDSVSVEVLATGLAHECLHDLLRHVSRGKAYPDKSRWNRAADLFINGSMSTQMRQVRKEGGAYTKVKMWTYPEWALMPDKEGFPFGLTADQYYALLEDKNSSGSCKIFSGCCGGISGNPIDKELEHQPEILAKGRPETECKAIAKETARALKKHMEGPGRGSTPGEWGELVDIGEERFRVPWRQKLANIVRQSIGSTRTGGMDYSMRRPSKRSYTVGIPRPGLIAYEPNLFFIVDSSGSMGKEQLSDALRICADVLKQTGINKAWFLEADTEPARNAPVHVTPHALRHMEIRGRGGTDFRPAVAFVERFKPRPAVCFYITDGDGAAPEAPPAGMHFIWCIVPSYYRRKPAPWGESILLDDSGDVAEFEDDEDD